MDYTQAIELAKKGDEKGFVFLYEKTYQSKYYLALQYMRDPDTAKDILQEAYLKAFQKLDTLQDPQAFSGWLGMIVANTAKNALKKKDPLLFSEIETDEDTEGFIYRIEDEHTDIQPERSMEKEETTKLVHEMIDSLSPEQRLCILMFHIEGASIHEIADTLGCSENTVKSRLNYGRKNLKAKAEELQKKGYKLFSTAPVSLFIFLLTRDRDTLSINASFEAASKNLRDQILSKVSKKNANVQAQVHAAGKTAAELSANSAKSAFIHTAAGKITIAVISACVIGGGAVYGISHSDSRKQTDSAAQNTAVQTQSISQSISVPQQETANQSSSLQQEEPEPSAQADNDSSQPDNGSKSIKDLYTDVLEQVSAGTEGYGFSDTVNPTGNYNYFTADMNGDGIPELIVGEEFSDRMDTIIANNCRVFSCEPSGNGYALLPINGEFSAETLFLASDHNGLFRQDFMRGTGDINVYRITIEGDTVISSENAELQFTFGTAEAEQFSNTNTLIEWTPISDKGKLDVLE